MNKINMACLVLFITFISMSAGCYARHGNTGPSIIVAGVFGAGVIMFTNFKIEEVNE